MTIDPMGDGRPLRRAPHEVAYETDRLLRSLPHASVAAVGPTGQFVAMPSGVPIAAGQSVITSELSSFEIVIQEDMARVIAAWRSALRTGVGRAHGRLLAHPDVSVQVHFVDSQALYGVSLCIVEGAVATTGPLLHRENLRPRFAVVRKNQFAEFIEFDAALEMILGRSDFIGRNNLDLVHPEDQRRGVASWMDLLNHPGDSRRIRLRQKHADGRWVWFELTNRNKLNDPDERCVVTEMLDISDEMDAHVSIAAREELLRRLTDALPIGVIQADPNGRVVHRNLRLSELLDRPEATTVEELFADVVDADRSEIELALSACLRGADQAIETEMVSSTGENWRCKITFRAIDGGAIICVDGVTEQARLSEKLRRQATYDHLTGCLNRSSTVQELQLALAGATDGVAVVFVDLDGFKTVNDKQGHAAGDALLTDIGTCLRNAVRSNDLVGRIGGDEFIGIGAGVSSADDALALAHRMADALSARLAPESPRRAVASLGVAWVSADEAARTDAEALISAADAAMYRSKAGGIGTPVLHDPTTSSLDAPLRRAG